MTALALSFQETQFDVVDREGQSWLRSSQIANALGYADEKAISHIYARKADEFTEQMTCVVKLTTQGQARETRIFSLRGCHLLAMFARTKVAKEFRKWVLDILDKEVGTQPVSNSDKSISPEQQGILFNLMAIRFPEGRDRPYGWSRFQRHFVVNSYKNLPVDKFAQACCYIPAMPDKEVKALPAPELTHLLPPDQAKEIIERVDRLCGLFHPFTNQFSDALGIRRLLQGIHPRIGTKQLGYIKLIDLK